MTNVNSNNYNNAEALLKRLQMKGMMDGKKEETQAAPEQENGEDTTPKPTCSENNAGSMQALDYQALMNSTLVQNMKVNNGKTQTITLESTGQNIKINGEDVKVQGTGTFEITTEGNNVVIKAGKNASSITFNNTKDLNITVEKSEKYPTRSFNLTTGAGNDNIVIAEGAKVGTINSGKGDDVVIIGENAQATNVKTGDGDDTVVNFGQASGIVTGAGNDAVLNKGKITNSIDTGSGADVIQNDGTTNNIYAGIGNDQIVNNGTVKSTLLGQADVDTIIDGRTIRFEKKSFELADNETAVINKDGSVTASSENGSKTFTPKGALDNIEIKTGSENITLSNTSQTVKLFNSNKISLETLNNIIELAAKGDKEAIALLDLPETIANEIMELIPVKVGITRGSGKKTTTINGEEAVKNADGTFSVKTDDLIIKNYDENQVLTSVTIGTGDSQRTINADSQLLIDFNNGTVDLETLNNSLVIEAYFPNATEEEKSWLNILQKIKPEGIDIRKIKITKVDEKSFGFKQLPEFNNLFYLYNNGKVFDIDCYRILNYNISPSENQYYTKDTGKLIAKQINNKSYTKYNEDGTKSVALYDSNPVVHQTSYTLYDADDNIITQETNEEYIDYMNKLNEIDNSLFKLVFNSGTTSPSSVGNRYANRSHLSLTNQVKSDIDMLVNAHEKGLEASGGVKDTPEYKTAFDNYVSSQMVKNYIGSEKSLSDIAKETNVGEVIETSGGLFVNNGTELKQLNMTKEQYIELFPPVARYSNSQGSTGDCYFIAPILNASMNNPRCYAEILQMFSVDSETGDVTLTEKGRPDSHVIFSNGELFVMDREGSGDYEYDGKHYPFSGATGCIGCQMIEQAFAISMFAAVKKIEISTVDIDDAMSYIEGSTDITSYWNFYGFDPDSFDLNAKVKVYLATTDILANFTQEQIDSLNSISEDYANYLEYNTKWENIDNQVRDLCEQAINSRYAGGVILLDVLNNLTPYIPPYKRDPDNNLFSICTIDNVFDVTKFRTEINKAIEKRQSRGLTVQSAKFYDQLSDEQLTHIAKIVLDNDGVNAYKYGHISGAADTIKKVHEAINLNTYILSALKFILNDADAIREKGLYTILSEQNFSSFSLDNLAEQLNNGEIIISLGMPKKEYEHGVMVSAHIYTISNIDVTNKTISINNPWSGANNEILLTYDEFLDSINLGDFTIFNTSLFDKPAPTEEETFTINGEPAVKNNDGTYTVTSQTDNGTITKNYSAEQKLTNFSFESTDGNYKFTFNKDNSSIDMANVEFSIDDDGNLHIKQEGSKEHIANLTLKNIPEGKKVIIEEGSYINTIDSDVTLNLINNGEIVRVNGTTNNDTIENNGEITYLETKEGNDNIINTGEIAAINTGAGNDRIKNDGGMLDTFEIDADFGENGTFINNKTGVTITKESEGRSANYTVNGEKAVLSSDYTKLSIVSDNSTKIFSTDGNLSAVTIKTPYCDINLGEDSNTLKFFNEGKFSLKTLNKAIEFAIQGNTDEISNLNTSRQMRGLAVLEILGPILANLPSGEDTVPSGDDTVPNGGDTVPSGDDTVPSGSDTVPSGDDTVPSGSDTVPSGDDTETIEESKFTNTRNQTICKLMGLETDSGITYAKYDTNGNIKSFVYNDISYNVLSNATGQITSLTGVKNGRKVSSDTFEYTADGKLRGKTSNKYKGWNSKLAETGITKYKSDGSISTEYVRSYKKQDGTLSNNVAAYIYRNENFNVTNYSSNVSIKYDREQCTIKLKNGNQMTFKNGETVVVNTDGTFVVTETNGNIKYYQANGNPQE